MGLVTKALAETHALPRAIIASARLMKMFAAGAAVTGLSFLGGSQHADADIVATFGGQTEEVQGITQGLDLNFLGIVDGNAPDLADEFDFSGIFRDSVDGVISLGLGSEQVFLSLENGDFNVSVNSDISILSFDSNDISTSVGLPANIVFSRFSATFEGSGLTDDSLISGLESFAISNPRSFDINFRDTSSGQLLSAEGSITNSTLTVSVPEPSAAAVVVGLLSLGIAALRRKGLA